MQYNNFVHIKSIIDKYYEELKLACDNEIGWNELEVEYLEVRDSFDELYKQSITKSSN